MKKFICFLAALVLFAMPANAGWNIKQKADGSAVWIDGDSVEVPVGDSGLVVQVSDVSTAATSFVVSHKKGKIKKIWVVNAHGDAFTANSEKPVFTFGVGAGSSATFTPISTGATISMTTATIGFVDSVAPLDVNVDVEQGYAISVASGGESTGAVEAHIVIVIE